MIWAFHVVLGALTFFVGAVVGSFLNVCIYRIPWQKSVIWPGSRCPRCLAAIAARDNVPILSWLALRGECRACGTRISARYPSIEGLVGVLFLGVYLTDAWSAHTAWGEIPAWAFGRMAYHQLLVALLVAATFIDYDYYIIPDEITVPGMFLGVALGALFPGVRPEPGTAATMLGGLWVGLQGLLVGGGLTWAVRIVAGKVFGREAMGFGDVTLMAMIGAFLGWQAAVLTFFLSPFAGIFHAIVKLVAYVGKRLRGEQSSAADRELPFGPYLSLAALALLLAWPWLWPAWGRQFFETLRVVFLFSVGYDV